jgi:hypothetical protein
MTERQCYPTLYLLVGGICRVSFAKKGRRGRSKDQSSIYGASSCRSFQRCKPVHSGTSRYEGLRRTCFTSSYIVNVLSKLNVIGMAKCYSMGKTWFKMEEGCIEQGRVYKPWVSSIVRVLFNTHACMLEPLKNEKMSNKCFGHEVRR